MGTTARIFPLHWGACRLLQFLTGLTLLVFALGGQLAVPATAAGLPTDVAAAAPGTAGPTTSGSAFGPAVSGTDMGGRSLDAAPAETAIGQAGVARAGSLQDGAGEPAVEPVSGLAGLASGAPQSATARTVGGAAVAPGRARAAHGSRAPPHRGDPHR